MVRYSIVEPWSVQSERHARNDQDDVTVITVETADLKDSHGGHVYREGAYRVSATGADKAKCRTKTFKGETAWSDAERYAGDVRSAIVYGR